MLTCGSQRLDVGPVSSRTTSGTASRNGADGTSVRSRTIEESRVRTTSGALLSAAQAIRQPENSLRSLCDSGDLVLEEDLLRRPLELASAETEFKFAGYLRRQHEAVDRARRHESRRIPVRFPYHQVPGLSAEMVQRFEEVQPETLGQALRIPGSTPAAVAVLGAYVNRVLA